MVVVSNLSKLVSVVTNSCGLEPQSGYSRLTLVNCLQNAYYPFLVLKLTNLTNHWAEYKPSSVSGDYYSFTQPEDKS